MLRERLTLSITILFSLVFIVGVYAANTPNLNQTINAGTLVTDIRDASRVTVATPAVAMSATTFSFDCKSGGSRPTGTFGTNSERIYVDNPGAAVNGWTLTLAATGGATDSWDNAGVTEQYDFNDAGGAPVGCGDSVGDADSLVGQLSVDPSVGTLTADCTTCTTSNITLGSASAFDQGTTDSVTLINAAAGSDDTGRWYLTDVSLAQTIPAEQPNDSYSINMTLTVTAL
jgi:hypothetical protein